MSRVHQGRWVVHLRSRTRGFLTAVLLLGVPYSFDQEASKSEALPSTALKTSSLAVFKNGLGFFVRQGNANLKNGEAMIPSVPESTLGTLWLAPQDPGASLEELVAYRYKAFAEHP